ncbi:MAG: neutral zinc metallopeptidase [Gaiellaceae bacterium]
MQRAILRDHSRSGGPLPEAYILAHGYGHHVEDLTGVLRNADRDTGPQGGQARVELQADCYAWLWVGNALDTGFVEDITREDVADALDAAAAVGDDRIQERSQGVTPENWTHGSAEQRQSWFVRGIEGTGSQSCDTFRGRVRRRNARVDPVACSATGRRRRGRSRGVGRSRERRSCRSRRGPAGPS